jgi:hypothetical protein
MKRSEMVKKISGLINNLESVKMTPTLKADAILYEIERNGMLPPSVLFHTTGEYEKAKNIVQECLSDYEASLEWQPENDCE